MSTIAFRWTEYAEPRFTGLAILVDGVPLEELVGKVEHGFPGAGDIAGDYAGLADWHVKEAGHYLGSARKTELLGCECGEAGCWPLLARVEVRAAEVRWSEFEQPFRPKWDYGTLAFTFDRAQYGAALRAAF